MGALQFTFFFVAILLGYVLVHLRMARCEKHGLQFLMEVAATDASQSRFVIRLQLYRGEASLFREVAARILPNVKL